MLRSTLFLCFALIYIYVCVCARACMWVSWLDDLIAGFINFFRVGGVGDMWLVGYNSAPVRYTLILRLVTYSYYKKGNSH